MSWLIRVIFCVICAQQGCKGQQFCGPYCLDKSYHKNFHSDLHFYDNIEQPNNVQCRPVDWNDKLSGIHWDDNTEGFWYPGKRTVPYGPYEYTLWGRLYGRRLDNVQIKSFDLKTNLASDCLIQQNGVSYSLIPQKCGSFRRSNCVVPSEKIQQYLTSYCSTCPLCQKQPSTCLADTNSTQIPTYTFLTSILVSDDLRILCPTCLKTTLCTSPVNMVLTFKEKKKTLYLAIYSPECIYNYDNPSYIYCFTDATDDLKKRVDVDFYMYQSNRNWNKNSSVIYKVHLEDFIGTYWCEAFSLSAYGIRKYFSNNITAYKKKHGNEFAVKIKMNDICTYLNCDSNDISDSLKDSVKDHIESLFDDNEIAKVRLMKICSIRDSYAEILLHISMSRRNSPVSDYDKLKSSLENLSSNVEIIYLKSSDFCLTEVRNNLTWPKTLPYQTVVPKELCLQGNGLPAWRMCGGDFVDGFEWMEVNGDCSMTNMGEETKLLHNFSSQEITRAIVNNVTQIVKTGNLLVTDLYFVSQILERFSENPTLNTSLFDASLDLIDGLLQTNSNLLANGQESFNLTDAYLRAVETVVTNLTETTNETVTFLKKQVLVHSFNPLIENASGFVLFRNRSFQNIQNFDNVTEWVHVDLALCISDEDISNIAASNLTNVSIVAVVYLSDSFFPSSDNNATPSLVMNLNIPDSDTYLRSRIPVLVRTDLGASNNSVCAFWDYGDAAQPKKGTWSNLGGEYGGEFENDTGLTLCSYSHLTHLALLIGDRINDAVINDSTTDTILSLITAIGSLLSCFGIFGIFLTALVFRSWCSKTGTQILLHLSVAMFLEILFMYVNDTWNLDCTAPGFVLHYVVLCKFSWMLVYAFCQYLRFVRVLGPMPKHLVLKSILVGWGFGLVPSLSVLLSDPQSYNSEVGFCYPTGLSLYLGVYLPILLILFINLGVFCIILFEVTQGQFEKVRTRKNKLQHMKLAVLLCSVLGIPWIIGFLFNVFPVGTLKTVFIYIFTVSSVHQGFVMFLFYVVFNPETRSFWSKVLLNKTRITSKSSMSVSIVS